LIELKFYISLDAKKIDHFADVLASHSLCMVVKNLNLTQQKQICISKPKDVLHRVWKNVPPLACYNFDTRKWILIFFGRNVTDEVSNQKMFYYATSNNLCFCTIPGKTGKHENCFHSNAVLVHQSLLDFFNFLTHDSYSRLPKSCNQRVQLGAVGGMVQEKGSWERCSSWTVLHA